MLKKEQYDLFEHNTMRLHCIADRYYEPESIEEMTELIDQFTAGCTSYYILGAGSNVILPPTLSTPVVCTRSVNKQLKIEGNRVECGASVRVQTLIRSCQKLSLGGMEYLFSVPCNVGGALYMNAGAGKKRIAQHLESVTAYDPASRSQVTLKASECEFGYRSSIFQHKDWIILSAVFNLPTMTPDEVDELIKQRIAFAREKLDTEKPSAGSVFNSYSSFIMKLLKGKRIGGACYSKKKTNWISNLGTAKYKDVIRLIRLAEKLHKFLFKKYHLEVIVWK